MAKNVGKISHKKSLSLNIKEYNNKITNQPWSLQKVCHLHNGIFQPIRHVSFTLSLLLCYSLNIRNYGMKGKTILCIYVCFSVSRYIEGG